MGCRTLMVVIIESARGSFGYMASTMWVIHINLTNGFDANLRQCDSLYGWYELLALLAAIFHVVQYAKVLGARHLR